MRWSGCSPLPGARIVQQFLLTVQQRGEKGLHRIAGRAYRLGADRIADMFRPCRHSRTQVLNGPQTSFGRRQELRATMSRIRQVLAKLLGHESVRDALNTLTR